jgi:DNA-binding XRE family transcriptional regulator
MTNIRDVLAVNMKAFRNTLGLSQAKLAEKVDTSTHYTGPGQGTLDGICA